MIQLIKKLTPAVVSISIERHMLQKNSAHTSSSFRSHPELGHGGLRSRERFQLDSLGSGFFSDRTGHIVTNAHVVEGATKILVTLSTGKVCTAKVVAIHPKVDLALIKIKPPYPLREAPVGDSSRVQVGEWVLAIGNPFGLGKTVTFGIVSGKGRFIGLGPDDDFIQTDASINPGNSGGPLFNMNGEVIGVNTAIIASGKGIGFSIPSNYIRQLVRSGDGMKQPARGWLGIYVEDMTEEQARALGLATPIGTFVDEVLSGTPASSAGMREGDLILSADGTEIRNGRHLSRIVSNIRPGDPIRMTILREHKKHALEVIVGKSPE
ncbi:MAG: trypsin-like peptidase domain-containing protein [Deltaproteobacteria bacterium]